MADQRRLPRRPKASTVRETTRRDTSSPNPRQQQHQQQSQKASNGSKEKRKSAESQPNEAPSSWSWIPHLISTLFTNKSPEPRASPSSEKEVSDSTPKTPANSASMAPKPRNSVELPPKPPLPSVEISPFPVDFNQNPDVDEKCSTGIGEVSPQTTDEGSRKASKEPIVDTSFVKKAEDQDIIMPSNNEPMLITVNAEDEQASDTLGKDLILPLNMDVKPEPPKLKEIFEMESSSTGVLSTEPSIRPKCSFQRVSFSRAQTVYLLPNTRQRVHKKVVRSRHDAWRRYGALMMIHELGGWSYTLNGKAKNFIKIEKGAPLPPPPVLPPILTEEEFHKRPIVTLPANNNSKSKRQRNNRGTAAAAKDDKKESKGDTDTSLSEEDSPSC